MGAGFDRAEPGRSGVRTSAVAPRKAAGVPVWSEIELAWRFLRGRLVAITGSNGKTTTTSLVGHILASAGMRVIVAGNIGTPLISHVDESTPDELTVAEISSFQLELIERMRPDIAVLLNLTPDHLDRQPRSRRMAARKLAFLRIKPSATPPSSTRTIWPRRKYAPAHAADLLVQPREARRQRRFPERRRDHFPPRWRSHVPCFARADIPLRGEHNVENVLAAACAAFLAGVAPAEIAAGVRSFCRAWSTGSSSWPKFAA